MRIGKVKEIHRYPVKSVGGERLAESEIGFHGIVGDRSFAFKRDSKFLTALDLPELFAYQAALLKDGNLFSAEITMDDGNKFDWNDPELVEYLRAKLGEGELEQLFTNPLEERGAYWEGHLLIISTSSLEKVGELCGKSDLDLRRFRPNLVIELDTTVPFEEERWIGKKLVINDCLVEINSLCPRCGYVNIDPANPARKDSIILKTIAKERDHNFGVYASVIKIGTMHEGDEIFLKNE